jgi:S-DNA-T family DNA segregation ATPase FtsK/SpoIIIE
MAKKRGPGRPKGSTNKKKGHSDPKDNVFGRQIFAIFLALFSILLFIGLFGAGGVAIAKIGEIFKMIFGYAAWIMAILLFWQAVQIIFHREDARISAGTWISIFAFLSLFSGLFQLMRADPTSKEFLDAGGGMVGWFLDYFFVPVMEKGVLALIYVVLILVLSMFALSLSPRDVFTKIGEFFKRDDKTEKENKKVVQELAKPIGERKFVVNGKSPEPKPERRGLFKRNAAPEDDTANLPEKPAALPVNNTNWKFPSEKLLNNVPYKPHSGDTNEIAGIIESTLSEFKIDGVVEGYNTGPRVTQYLYKPQAGIAMGRISACSDNLKFNLGVKSLRIEAPIPGEKYVGIELPNEKPSFVSMRSIMESAEWKSAVKPLTFVVGKNISGKSVVLDLQDLPHLLIAGTTGSGKSVMMNVLMASLLFRNTPDDLKMIMIDPKGTEMAQYKDMPHLVAPVVSGVNKEEIARSVKILNWAVDEMNRRYDFFAEKGVRDIKAFKKKYPEEKLPYIVFVIDEWTSFMDSARSEREVLQTAVQQLASKGRAAGFHEIVMMQAPRAKYIQGALKANMPAGFAFSVLNKMESNQIISQSGAEQLMGKGDMLMKTVELKDPIRVQAAVIEDEELDEIVGFLRQQSPPQYDETLMAELAKKESAAGAGGNTGDADYDQAVQLVIAAGKASTSYLQRKMNIGYGKAAALIDRMEANGIVGPQISASRPRDLLVSAGDIEIKGDD